jgi:hypothetical protein
MEIGTGKSSFCPVNNFGGPVSPGSPDPSREDLPARDNSSHRCVFLTCDRKDCMAFCEPCSWVISQGMCIRPEACRE